MTKTASGVRALIPIVVLVSICAVAGLLLGVVHQVTEPVAAANAEREAQELYASLMPEAASFEALPCNTEGCTAALKAVDGRGETLGYVIVAQAKGYGGQVPIVVAFNTQGVVLEAVAMPSEETPGLGTRVAEDAYIGQYVGLGAEHLSPESIDLISGATISSKAVLSAFNCAVDAYKEVS